MTRHHAASRRTEADTASPLVDQLAADVQALRNLLPTLEDLLPEPVADPTQGTASHRKVSGSPAPWHDQAAGVYFDIHAGARRLEDSLLLAVAGHPRSRGASDQNTDSALEAIPDLAAAAGDPDAVTFAAHEVARWLRDAEQLRDVDRRDPWTVLPRAPKATPPPCPYCDTFALRMNRRTGQVRCMNPDCRDEDDRRPIARMEQGPVSHREALVFRDGREIIYETSTTTDEDA